MYASREVVVSSDEPAELRSCLSGNDAMKLLEFVQKSLSCNSNKDFIALYPMIQELLAFDYANAILGYYDKGESMGSGGSRWDCKIVR
jgi:hypothetical protein